LSAIRVRVDAGLARRLRQLGGGWPAELVFPDRERRRSRGCRDHGLEGRATGNTGPLARMSGGRSILWRCRS